MPRRFASLALAIALAANSPARDAGVDVGLTKDFDGDPRPIGAGFDIGFDEFVLLNKLFLPLVMR
jgi:hypothetical protein